MLFKGVYPEVGLYRGSAAFTQGRVRFQMRAVKFYLRELKNVVSLRLAVTIGRSPQGLCGRVYRLFPACRKHLLGSAFIVRFVLDYKKLRNFQRLSRMKQR